MNLWVIGVPKRAAKVLKAFFLTGILGGGRGVFWVVSGVGSRFSVCVEEPRVFTFCFGVGSYDCSIVPLSPFLKRSQSE